MSCGSDDYESDGVAFKLRGGASSSSAVLGFRTPDSPALEFTFVPELREPQTVAAIYDKTGNSAAPAMVGMY